MVPTADEGWVCSMPSMEPPAPCWRVLLFSSSISSQCQRGHTRNSSFLPPGRLLSCLLIAGWNHCFQMFALELEWSEADMKKYLGQQLCINDFTISKSVECSHNFVLLRDVTDNPEEYTGEERDEYLQDSFARPSLYKKPRPPAMWFLSQIEDKPEGVVHLSMGVQEAIFKFNIRWASDNRRGAALQRRMAEGLSFKTLTSRIVPIDHTRMKSSVVSTLRVIP